MTVVLDTSAVVALYDGSDPDHGALAEWVEVADEDLVTTPLALAEMDYLVRRRGGDPGRRALWRDLDAGAYAVRWWADGLAETLRVARRHPFLGLTDASLVALAGIVRTTRIVTLDDHFRSVPTPGGEAFVVLPADA
ncbi:MAG: PIN domain-containing protein [Solirubrobacterales bacterium]|nr:PIN domain-containing protein [Solirubrobacterales bacterium]